MIQLNYLFPAMVVLLIFVAFRQDAYVSEDNFPATVTLLVMFGCVNLLCLMPRDLESFKPMSQAKVDIKHVVMKIHGKTRSKHRYLNYSWE